MLVVLGPLPSVFLRHSLLNPPSGAIKLRNVMKKHMYFLLQMTQIKTLLIHDKEREENKLLLNLI